MKNLLLSTIVLLFAGATLAQCSANFTANVNQSTASFTNTSVGSNLQYLWDFGDGNTSSQMNPQHTYATQGVYTTCLTIYSNDSISTCVDSVCYPINITDTTGGSGTPCDASFQFNVNNSSVSFTSTGAGSYGYFWDFGDGNTSTQANPNHIYASSGNYLACLTVYSNDSINFCSDSVCQMINVIDTIGGGGSGCNASMSLTADDSLGIYGQGSGTGALSYEWFVIDDQGTLIHQDQGAFLSYTPAQSGYYNVCLVAYDSLGICDSICNWVTYDSDSSLVGLSGINLEELTVYPNPTSTVLKVDIGSTTVGQVFVVDMAGREAIRVDVAQQVTEINVYDLMKGMYMVRFVDGAGNTIATKRFIKN